MAGQGSGGNVLAALCSLLIPGLGQLLQGRLDDGDCHVCVGWRTLVVSLGVDYSLMVDHRCCQIYSRLHDRGHQMLTVVPKLFQMLLGYKKIKKSRSTHCFSNDVALPSDSVQFSSWYQENKYLLPS